MLCDVLGRQEEQAAHPQIGTSREIQEGVRRGAANIQQLAISESDFRITCRKRARVRCNGSRWFGAHPVQNGLDFLFRGLAVGHNCIRESVEIPPHVVFPDTRVKHRHKRGDQQQIAAPPDDAKRTMLAPLQVTARPFRFCLHHCREASVAYNVSISRTGSSQPRRDATLVHPAAKRSRSSGSSRTRSSASESAAALWCTASPASSASSGAIPHCSVTIAGVPAAEAVAAGTPAIVMEQCGIAPLLAATASAAVFPKFSFCEGSTKTSASLYAAHLFSPKTGPAN